MLVTRLSPRSGLEIMSFAQRIFGFVVLSILWNPAHSFGQGQEIGCPCHAILIPDLSKNTITENKIITYLWELNKSSYEEAKLKHKGEFQSLIKGLPFNIEGDFENFRGQLMSYVEGKKIDINSIRISESFVQSLNPDVIQAWDSCMKDWLRSQKHGILLFVDKNTERGVEVRFRWVPYPGEGDGTGTVVSSLVIGGRVAVEGTNGKVFNKSTTFVVNQEIPIYFERQEGKPLYLSIQVNKSSNSVLLAPAFAPKPPGPVDPRGAIGNYISASEWAYSNARKCRVEHIKENQFRFIQHITQEDKDESFIMEWNDKIQRFATPDGTIKAAFIPERRWIVFVNPVDPYIWK